LWFWKPAVSVQVTGRSTAKITTQHSLIYRHLIDTAGQDTAMFYAAANRTAVERIRTWIETLDIACDYERKAAYAYAYDPERMDAIRQEAEVARILGLDEISARSVRDCEVTQYVA
jgi:hypothetical protein